MVAIYKSIKPKCHIYNSDQKYITAKYKRILKSYWPTGTFQIEEEYMFNQVCKRCDVMLKEELI